MDITEGFKKVLLASVGAAALTVEKSTEVVDTLVRKGELTVEQGKALNKELKHKVEKATEVKEDTSLEGVIRDLSSDDLTKLKEMIAKAEAEKGEPEEKTEEE